jgi:hypothetical protein
MVDFKDIQTCPSAVRLPMKKRLNEEKYTGNKN